MADIVFYEKPGCSGNAQQKKVLAAAGHTVIARDLRKEPWTRLRLLGFFAGLPVSAWFNRSAPAIKSGEIIPEELDEITALALMLDNPLLIRRPLMEVGEERRVGFDAAEIAAWIGLGERPPTEDLESCRHPDGHRCGEPGEAH
jgi:nitrogenase-associated protein